MSDSYEVENNGIDGEVPMGSLNHSSVQFKLGSLLDQSAGDQLHFATELSLDISQHDLSEYKLDSKYEIKPNICAYIHFPVIPDKVDDLLTVSQMPDLAIEILSPRQSIGYLIRKTKAYFELGVKSCWIVNPSMQTVTVYSHPNQRKSFDIERDTEVIDEVMVLCLPMKEIFPAMNHA
jgi:Uma2 family endonuclease